MMKTEPETFSRRRVQSFQDKILRLETEKINIHQLKEEGHTVAYIAHEVGLPESSVLFLLKKD
jgi:hypothetical protein